MGLHFGFISTRFSGLDGVSLESAKWADILESEGYECSWFAGELDRSPSSSYLSPLAHFKHPDIQILNDAFFATDRLALSLLRNIYALRDELIRQLRDFIEKFQVNALVIQNALSIPMNIPLAMAITEVIRETGIPTIAHHHDFSWERRRFLVNGSSRLVNTYFPFDHSSIQHVVINSDARRALLLKRGVASEIIPNVMDFANCPKSSPRRTRLFLEKLGLSNEDRIVLQPTRIVPRKGIELAIDLINGLQDDRFKLVVSHPSGDEGDDYCHKIRAYAKEKRVDLRLVDFPVDSPWALSDEKSSRASLWDIYPAAELVTLPSLCEGFGNAFVEAVWFRKPILINRYDVYLKDIKPLGFKCIEIDGEVTSNTLRQVDGLLRSPEIRKQMVDSNYFLADQNLSYRRLKRQLLSIMAPLFRSVNIPLNTQTISKERQPGRLSGTAIG